jgi:hypothetical protein
MYVKMLKMLAIISLINPQILFTVTLTIVIREEVCNEALNVGNNIID